MAQNYVRQSTFSDGDTITASLFNNEYNQLLNAFSYSPTDSAATGHRHDGSTGEGGNIPKIGDIDFLNKIEVDGGNNRWGVYVEVAGVSTEQVRFQDGSIVPVTTNDIDLGSGSLQFKDLYIDGTANIDSLALSSGSTVTVILDEDNLATNSDTALATQQSIKAYVDSQITANNELSEILVNGNTTGGTDISVSTGDDITFAASSKAIFGAGSDLQIYHDGSNNWIDSSATTLAIRAPQFVVQDAAGTKNIIWITQPFASTYDVRLSYDGSTKLTTTSTGIDVTGNATFDDNGKAIFGAGSDLQIYHNGADNYVDAAGVGHLYLQSQGDDKDVKIQSDDGSGGLTEYFRADGSLGQAQLYYYGSKKLHTVTGGIDVTGTAVTDGVTVDGNILLNSEGNELQFNTSSAPVNKIYSDDTYTTNGLTISADNGITLKSTSNYLLLDDTGTNEMVLNVDGGERVRVTSTGIDVTGTVTADGLTVDGDVFVSTSSSTTDGTDGAFLDIKNTDTTTSVVSGVRFLNGTTTAFKGAVFFEDLAGDGRGDVVIASNNVASGSAAVGLADQRLRISRSGDISFYEDTGTTAKLFWDASQERLEIDSVNANPLVLERNGGTDANVSIQFNCTTNDWYVGTNPANNFAIGTSLDQTNAPFQIDSSGNVGIGTSSPQQLLHVSQGTNATATTIRIENTDTTIDATQTANAIEFYTNDASTGGTGVTGKISHVAVNAGSTYALAFSSYNGSSLSERMRIDEDGNIGIGTTTPDNKFHVVSGAAGEVAQFTGAVEARGLSIRSETNTDASAHVVFNSQSGGSKGMFTFETDGTERMRIDSSGNVNVGIGATTVTGLSGTNLIVGSASGGEIVTYNNTNAIADGDFVGAFLFGNDDNAATEDHFAGMWAKAAGTAGSMDIHFSAGKADYEAGTAHMTLDSSGNLLVGTTDTDPATNNVNGFAVSSEGVISASKGNEAVANFSRRISDGDIAVFKKGGVPIGSIGSEAGGFLSIGNADTGLSFLGSIDAIGPYSPSSLDGRDAVIDLGTTTRRFKDLYLSSSVDLRNSSTTSVDFIDTDTAAGIGKILGEITWTDSNSSYGNTGIKLQDEFQTGGIHNFVLKTNDATNPANLETRLAANDFGVQFYEGSSEIARFDSTGLGIGTTSPAAKIDTAYTDSATYSSTSPSADLILSRKNTANTNNQTVGIRFDVTSWSGSTTGGAAIEAIQPSNASTADLAFLTRNSGTWGERMRIDSSGNVGIGTTSPSATIHANSASNGDTYFRGETGSTKGLLFSTFTANATDHAGHDINAISSLGEISFSVGSTKRLTIDSSGNIGIGTTSPNTALHVSSATTTKSVVETTGASSDALIEFTKGQGSGNTWSMGIDHSNSSAFSLAYLSNGSPSLTTHGVLTVDTSGQVGIGTDSPATELHVVGSSGDSRITVEAPASQNTWLAFRNTGGADAYLIGYDPSASAFRFYDDVANTERLRIDSSGRVLISGTSALTTSTSIQPTFQIIGQDAATGSMYISRDEGSASPAAIYGYKSRNSGAIVQDNDELFALIVEGSDGVGPIRAGTIKFEVDGTPATNNIPTAIVFERSDGAAGLTESMRIDSSGQVGIGTSNPIRGLQVNSASSNFGNTFLVDSASGTTGTGGGVIFGSDDGLGTDVSVAAIQGIKENNTAGNQQGALLLTTKNSLAVNTERMRIDSSGNVGIGTASPDTLTHLFGSTGATLGLKIEANGWSNDVRLIRSAGENDFYITNNYDTAAPAADNAANGTSGLRVGRGFLSFHSGASGAFNEAMRIDSSGNVLVGTTTTTGVIGGSSNNGSYLAVGGGLFAARSGDAVAHLNRNDSDGEIIEFRKDGAIVGSIGSYVTGPSVFIGSGNTGVLFADGSDSVHPWNPGTNAGNDGALDLGSSTQRWKDLYLSGGVDISQGTEPQNAFIDFNQIINDDAVYSFTPDKDIGVIYIYGRNANYSNVFGMVSYRTVATAYCLEVLDPNSLISTSTSVLTGTSGTDGQVTISAVSSDGKIYIENREGGAISIGIHISGQ